MTTNTVRPMFPHTVDSTIMSAFRSCPQKFYRQYMQHWKPRSTSVHLVAGGAFASGIEAARDSFYVQGLGSSESEANGLRALIKHYGNYQAPASSAKSLDRMIGALEFYLSRYPLGADGAEPLTLAGEKRAIEYSFSEPLGVLHPVTGMPILYTGRSDMLARRAGGNYAYDEKTTSSLGDSWSRQWEMRSQFTGYSWAAARQGIHLAGTIVRGVSILKTKYETMEVSTYRSRIELARWEAQINRDLARMISLWESGHWDYNLDGACTEYGGCIFVKICKANDPDQWLPIEFTQKVWDPLERKEISIPEYEAKWGHDTGITVTPLVTLTEKESSSLFADLQRGTNAK